MSIQQEHEQEHDTRVAELLRAAAPESHHFAADAIRGAGLRRRRARIATRLLVGSASALILVGGVAASASWLPGDSSILTLAAGGGETTLSIHPGTESPVTAYTVTGESMGGGLTKVTVSDPNSGDTAATFTASPSQALAGIAPKPSRADDGMWLAVVPDQVAPVSVTTGPGQRVGEVKLPGSDLQVVAINSSEDKGGGKAPVLYWTGPEAGSTDAGARFEHTQFTSGAFSGYNLTWSPDLKILEWDNSDGTAGGGYDNSSPQEPILVMESADTPGRPDKLLVAIIPAGAQDIRVIDGERNAPTWTSPIGDEVAVIADVRSYSSGVHWTVGGKAHSMINTP
ncbi:hypothetical protein [Janibacter limosus]|uniref:Uncharacterized protein n=1 Tax=Janibacter limosus TaxID=53458 RepID=A0A4P6MU56_9MICO|nr:hypothetical protein [Janibacter limosus]QBF47204.1 hypothetical protein EXU32_13665 [Janibacter limosus]